MRTVLEARGRQMEVHYVNAGLPAVIEENFAAEYLELGDLSLELEEDLLDQESLYQSIQSSGRNNNAKASASSDSNSNQDQSAGEKRVPEKEGESSQSKTIDSQLAADEALAIALQEEEIKNGFVSFSGPAETTPVNREVNSTGTSAQADRQDNIDPDHMTYEQLQSLGEEIGTESRGLSDELISYLPSFKYKTGFFSKKDKHEECVICSNEYKNREELIDLPCHHQYHKKCITPWLKLNKTCPVCTKEVFGS